MEMKKIIGLGLATILFVTLSACAPNSPNEKDETTSDNSTSVSELEDSQYINYRGTVSEVIKDPETQITIDGEEKENQLKDISFNISKDTTLVSYELNKPLSIENIKEGDTIEAIYDKDSPMTRSLPPIVNAKAIVLRKADDKDKLGVKLSKFNKELISQDNSLELKIDDDTSIVDLDGKELAKEDIVEKEVIVFFGPTQTLSMPGQSNAKKIILLK